jgi:hypothetical protein
MFLQFAFDEIDRNFIFWLSLNLKSALCVYEEYAKQRKKPENLLISSDFGPMHKKF